MNVIEKSALSRLDEFVTSRDKFQLVNEFGFIVYRLEQFMYYKEAFQGDAIWADDIEDEDLENIYIICQDGEINLFDFLYNM